MDMSKRDKIKSRIYGVTRYVCVTLFVLVIALGVRPAQAHCLICEGADCTLTTLAILENHAEGERIITDHATNRFELYREWILEIFFVENLLPSMMMMTEQLSAVGMHQMFGVGALMDAKIQLETQRLFQEMQVQAINDYQPSENYCYFGTNIRSVSASEEKGGYNKMALNKIGMDRQTGEASQASAGDNDMRARWEMFVTRHCQVYNNNWDPANPTISGLQPACDTSKDSARANADVKYGRFVEGARTIAADFTDPVATNEEQDIIALSRNLYGHVAPSNTMSFLNRLSAQEYLLDQRAVIAKRNVAMNSFNSIVGMKTSGTSSGPADTTQYMAAVLQNLGVIDPEEIQILIGENPSYMAQMEILAKRVYQDQSFYANLYDKPENVERTSVAMRAMEVMLEREMFESRLRKEMLVSVLLSAKLNKHYEAAESTLESLTAANR